jgi:hypothetical protein
LDIEHEERLALTIFIVKDASKLYSTNLQVVPGRNNSARETGIEIQGGKAECMLIEGDATYLILDRGSCKQASKENRIFRDSVLRLLLRDFHRELQSGLRPRHS